MDALFEANNLQLQEKPNLIDFFGCQLSTGVVGDSVAKLRADTVGQLQVRLRSDLPSADGGAGLSLFQHSGLPRIERFPSFFNAFGMAWRDSYSLGSIGVNAGMLEPLLTELYVRPRRELLPGFLRNVAYVFYKDRGQRNISENEVAYANVLSYLARLDWKESDQWDARRGPEWAGTHSEPLSQYFVDLFHGRLIDRNGTALAFNFHAKDFSFDNLEVSPKVAGQIVATLIEFLGDRLMGVPFYAKGALEAYEKFRKVEEKKSECFEDIKKIETALAAIDESDWASIVTHASVPKQLARQTLGSLARADQRLLDAIDTEKELAEVVRTIENGTADQLTLFTCFKTTVIPEYLHCIFFNSMDGDTPVAGSPDCDRGSIGGEEDFAGLVGAVTAFAARNAEKNVRSLVGGLIRGSSIVSLNNEVLAEVIGSTAGTLAKKTAEFLTWQFLSRFVQDVNVMKDDPKAKRSILKFLRHLHEDGTFDAAESPARAGLGQVRPHRAIQSRPRRESGRKALVPTGENAI